MQYEQSELYDLIDAVEDEGGTYLDEICSDRKMTIGSKELTIAGCGNLTIFEIPYQFQAEGTNATVLALTKVCGVCDDMGWWPRYAHLVTRKTIRSDEDA